MSKNDRPRVSSDGSTDLDNKAPPLPAYQDACPPVVQLDVDTETQIGE
jgi:hypothetical protein